jgi:hypothetical protein
MRYETVGECETEPTGFDQLGLTKIDERVGGSCSSLVSHD